jgi:uncharacterized integral membrane protein
VFDVVSLQPPALRSTAFDLKVGACKAPLDSLRQGASRTKRLAIGEDLASMRIISYLIVALITAICLAFAFANRDFVTINFDPLGGNQLPPVAAPQYLVILIAVAIGVVAGSVATWFRQGANRRRAREALREAERLRAELRAAHASTAVTNVVPLARQA